MPEQPSTGPGQPPDPRWGPGPALTGPSGHNPYPRQELSEQQVQGGRSRRPIYIGLAVVVALLVAGGVGFATLRDTGEDTRAEYCAELEDLTDDGDLSSAFGAADQSSVSRLLKIKDIAPAVVADDWTLVSDVVQSGLDGQEADLSKLLAALNALKAISRDAESNCDLVLDLPDF